MRPLVLLFVSLLATTRADAQLTTVSQTLAPVVLAGNSIACASGSRTLENSYWRRFDPAPSGITGPVFLAGVDLGIEFVGTISTVLPAHPVIVTMYDDPAPPAGGGIGTLTTLVPLATQTFEVAAGTALTISPMRFDCAVPFTPNGTNALVIEITAPDQGDAFFIGSNSFGETAPGFLSAPACGVNVPTTFASLGFFNTMIIIDLVFDPTTPPTSPVRHGSCDDLLLATGVNSALVDTVTDKVASASASDSFTYVVQTPRSGFAATTVFVIGTLSLQNSPYANVSPLATVWLPTAATIWSDVFAATPIAPIGTPPVLAAPGIAVTFVLSPLLTALELGLQGFAIGPPARNGLFASTDHHRVVLN